MNLSHDLLSGGDVSSPLSEALPNLSGDPDKKVRTNLFCLSKKTVPLREPVCKKCGKPVMDAQQELCPDCYGKIHFFYKRQGCFFYMKKKSNNLFIDLNSRIKENMANFTVQRWTTAFWKREFLLGNRMRSIPIPMYRRKQRRRGYNQAEVLARGLGEKLSIPVNTTYLKRIKKTIPQKELGKKEREINLKNAF